MEKKASQNFLLNLWKHLRSLPRRIRPNCIIELRAADMQNKRLHKSSNPFQIKTDITCKWDQVIINFISIMACNWDQVIAHFKLRLSNFKVPIIKNSKSNFHGRQANPQWLDSGGKDWQEGDHHGRIGSDLHAAGLEEAGKIPLSCEKAEGHWSW